MRLQRVAQFSFRPKLPYNFVLTVHKPAGWSWGTPFEVWKNETLWSGLWLESRPLGLKVSLSRGLVQVLVFSNRRLPSSELARLETRLRGALGIDEDLRPLYRLMHGHRLLGPLARRLRGMREGWTRDLYSSLTLAVLLQMAPIKRSEEMWDCFIRRHGSVFSFDGVSIRTWPTPQAVAKLQPHAIAKECRLGYRAKSLVRIARSLVAGFPSIEDLAKLTPEAAADKLMELYGVGEYTAGFATPHPSFTLDVWSVKIFHQLIFGRPAPTKDPRSAIERTTRAATKLWGPWRGYIFAYVLNDLPFLERRFGLETK